MLEKILTEMAKIAYPNRDISAERIGRKFFLRAHDTTGCKQLFARRNIFIR